MRHGLVSYSILVLAVVTCVVWLSVLLTVHFPAIPLWARSVVLFTGAKLSGDLVSFLMWRRQELFFYEDLVWDMALFAGLGLLAAVAITVAERYGGTPVDPAFPGLGAYVVSLFFERGPAQPGTTRPKGKEPDGM